MKTSQISGQSDLKGTPVPTESPPYCNRAHRATSSSCLHQSTYNCCSHTCSAGVSPPRGFAGKQPTPWQWGIGCRLNRTLQKHGFNQQQHSLTQNLAAELVRLQSRVCECCGSSNTSVRTPRTPDLLCLPPARLEAILQYQLRTQLTNLPLTDCQYKPS